MKGSLFMSQTINVELTVNGDTDVLVFKLDDETPDKYVINLTSESDQEKIKEVFTKLLEIVSVDDVSLVLSFADGYSNALYKEVADEYINALNSEIATVREELKEKLKG